MRIAYVMVMFPILTACSSGTGNIDNRAQANSASNTVLPPSATTNEAEASEAECVNRIGDAFHSYRRLDRADLTNCPRGLSEAVDSLIQDAARLDRASRDVMDHNARRENARAEQIQQGIDATVRGENVDLNDVPLARWRREMDRLEDIRDRATNRTNQSWRMVAHALARHGYTPRPDAATRNLVGTADEL